MFARADIIAARRRIWHDSKFTFAIGLFLPKRSRPLFWAWYTYLRWVDDSADEKAQTTAESRVFLQHHLEILSSELKYPDWVHDFEKRLLFELLQHDVQTGGQLRKHIRAMLESIQFDVARDGQLCDHIALHRNYLQEVSSYLSSIAYFCDSEDNSPPIGHEAAIAAKYTHILRDLAKDVRMNHLNISREDTVTYQLDYTKFAMTDVSQPFVNWAAAQVRMAEVLLESGKTEIRRNGNIRYRIITLCLAAKYEGYLQDIRRRDFDLRTPPRAGGFQFLSNVVNNVLREPLRKASPQTRPSIRKPIVRLSSSSAIRFYCDLLPIANYIGLTDLKETLKNESANILERPRINRRFRGGYWIGRSSFLAIAPAATHNGYLPHLAGLLVAYWGLSAIEFDRLQDEAVLTSEEIVKLSHVWLTAIRAAVDDIDGPYFQMVQKEAPTYTFVLLSERLMSLIRAISSASVQYGNSTEIQVSRNSFYHYSAFLMHGQITSTGQTDLFPPKNWSWYYRKIMNHKNVEFLLCPFRLWCFSEDSAARFAEVASSFQLLNSAYVHYQLLDDLADVKEDLRQGIIGAPGFILLSQAAIAEVYLAIEDDQVTFQEGNDVDLDKLDDVIYLSDLLCSEFTRAPLFDSLRHRLLREPATNPRYRQIGTALQCSICNTEIELHWPVREVAAQRVRQGSEFLEALRMSKSEIALSVILKSNVTRRILASVGEDGAVAALNNALLKINNNAHIRILYIMERLMRRTLTAAILSSEMMDL